MSDLYAHLSVKHPSFVEGIALSSVVIPHHDIEFSLNQTGHGHAPLDGRREING